jgi:hypothetical protein
MEVLTLTGLKRPSKNCVKKMTIAIVISKEYFDVAQYRLCD